ncbi:MAG TPA: response regulator [Burkholderiales bacterium]|nr:response regulator [Burkholderiales bacterium]
MARILVIDDDGDVRALLRIQLENAGHEVRAARDGSEGLAMQRDFDSEVVITDIFMPEMEGVETIRELKEQFPAVKVIVISGGSRLAAGRRSFTARDLGIVAGELGVAAVLQKPFDNADLLRSVDSALQA